MELLIILVVILLLFGAKRLPDLARSLGKSLNEFKRGREEGSKSLREPEPAPPAEKKIESEDQPKITE
jgi:sec-independent protein translocase protein TatA